MTPEIPRPDDWHAHFRDGDFAADLLPAHASFGRVIAMPNLTPPVTTPGDASAYADRLRKCAPAGVTPVAVGYLTDATRPDEVLRGYADGAWKAMKLYPAHATTNAAQGVTDIAALDPVFAAMAGADMPLLVHGEVTDPEVDVFDREEAFLERVLSPLRARHPTLRVVIEHASTAAAVRLVLADASGRLAATVTPHHLVWTRNDLFRSGLRPHCYCLPVVKTEADRRALVEAVTRGDPRFFLGTDSAPHPVHRKEADGGAAGVFNAPTALATYAEVFEEAGALDHLATFASTAGAQFYGVPVATTATRLRPTPWTPDDVWSTRAGPVRVFRGGERLRWRVDA